MPLKTSTFITSFQKHLHFNVTLLLTTVKCELQVDGKRWARTRSPWGSGTADMHSETCMSAVGLSEWAPTGTWGGPYENKIKKMKGLCKFISAAVHYEESTVCCPEIVSVVSVTESESRCLVRLFTAPWTIPSLEFFRPECWGGWPFPSPGDLPNAGTEPGSPAPQAASLPAEPPGKPTQISRLWATPVLSAMISQWLVTHKPHSILTGSVNWASFRFSSQSFSKFS